MFGQAQNQLAHVLRLRGIQAIGGFVQNQQLRFVDNRLRHADALLIAARQRADGIEGAVCQIGRCQHLAQRLGAVPSPAQSGHVVQIVHHRHFRIHRAVFRQVAQLPLHDLRLLGDIHAIHARGAGAWLQIARQHLHDGGLAGAVVAQQTDDFALPDRKADVVDRQRFAVSARQLIRVDHRADPPDCPLH